MKRLMTIIAVSMAAIVLSGCYCKTCSTECPVDYTKSEADGKK